MSAKTPHILGVIYNTELYGSERGTLQATRSLQEAGYRITIAGSKRKPEGGPVGDAARAQGHDVKLIQFGSHLKKTWLLYNRSYRKSTWTQMKLSHRQLQKIVSDTQPSQIMICSTSVLPYIIGLLLFSRVPVVYRMGDAPELKSKLHRPLWKWLVRKSSRVIAISNFMKSCLLANGGRFLNTSKIHVIRNIAPHRPGSIDAEITDSLTQSKRPFQWVFVGQLTQQKGVDLLIEALIELDDPNVGCWILGEFMGNKGGLPELIDHERTRWILERPTKGAIIRSIQHLQGLPNWVNDIPTAIQAQTMAFGTDEFQQAWVKAVSAS